MAGLRPLNRLSNIALQGARAKLRRAKAHLDTIDDQIGAFLRHNPYRIRVDQPSDQLYVLCVADAPVIPDEEWALTIGDCVHNLRSSLDYVAWQLAGADPADTETQFPLFETRAGWDRRAGRRMKRLPDEVREFIERVQPYHAKEPRSAALNAVRVLDDADKHKLLTVTATVPLGLAFDAPVPAGFEPRHRTLIVNEPLLFPDAILATITFPDGCPAVALTAELAVEIVFGESLGLGAKVRVVSSLRNMCLQVADLFDLVESKFVDSGA